MPSTKSECDQDSLCLSCSMKANAASDHSRSLCCLAQTNTHLPGTQKVIWGSGNPNLGTGSNPPPQDLTHTVPNIEDLLALDAGGIVEPVLANDHKLQKGGNPITSREDGQPSQGTIKPAANNEKQRATRKSAKQRGGAEQRPKHKSRAHEDGLPTILSSSSDDDVIPGRPPTAQTSKRSNNRSSTHSETKKALSKLHKQLFSTQAGFGKVYQLSVRTKQVSVMDSSKPTEQPPPAPTNDTKSAPPAQDQNQSQLQQKKEKKAKPPKQASAPTSLSLSPALIDLRVGHILRCIPHENADSLYVSTIAMGDPEGTECTQKDEQSGGIVRTVCSGLRGLIPIEQMQDRKVIVMANLKPVTMRGIKSAAMVLAASPPRKEGDDPHSADRVVELVSPPEGSEGGDKVYFEGWEYGEGRGPEKVLNPKKKQWEAVQPGLYTSEELTVVFDAGRTSGVEGEKGELIVEGGKGKCKVPSLKGARLS